MTADETYNFYIKQECIYLVKTSHYGIEIQTLTI